MNTPTSVSYGMLVFYAPVCSVSNELAQRIVKLPVGEGFAKKAAGALLERLHSGELVRECRDHQDADVRITLDQPLDALSAIHLGHRKIHRNDGRLHLFVQRERLFAVAGGADKIDIRQIVGPLDA